MVPKWSNMAPRWAREPTEAPTCGQKSMDFQQDASKSGSARQCRSFFTDLFGKVGEKGGQEGPQNHQKSQKN